MGDVDVMGLSPDDDPIVPPAGVDNLPCREVQRMFDERGYDVTFDYEGDYFWRAKHRPTGAEIGLSAHLFRRVSLEFLAPSWLVEHQCNINERMRSGEFGPGAPN